MSFDKTVEKTEKPKETHEANPQALPTLDRLALLKEHSKHHTPDTAKLHDFQIDGLHDDPGVNKRIAMPKDGPAPATAAGSGSATTDKSSGRHDVPVPKPRPADAPDGKPVDRPVDKSIAARDPPSENEIVKRTGNDTKAPTVAFVDQFKEKREDLGDGTRVAHGEISRAAAENNGFNTVAIQNNGNSDSNGDQDYSKTINDINKKIDDGQLKLGRGDVVNISLGNTDPTFDQFNKFLGGSADKAITRDNLAAQKDNIIARLKEIGKDQSRSEAERVTANRIVNTNEAIDKLKAKDIMVVHAAGNQGADHFSPDFMSATELSSVKPSGTPDEFSAANTATKGANGVLPVRFKNDVDMLSPTPVANQKGSLEIGDAGVKFPSTGSEIFPDNNRAFNRENFVDGKPMPILKGDQKPLDPSFLSPETAAKGDGIYPSKAFPGAPILPSDRFSGTAPFPKKFDLAFTDGLSPSEKLKPGEVAAEGVIAGTSYANIDFLKRNFDRLKALKDSGN